MFILITFIVLDYKGVNNKSSSDLKCVMDQYMLYLTCYIMLHQYLTFVHQLRVLLRN